MLLLEERNEGMSETIWSLLPPVVTIILALATKEVYMSLAIGIFMGAFMFTGFSVLGAIDTMFKIMSDKVGGNVYILVFLVLLVLQFGALAVLYVEHNAPDASITSASDALWWVFVTITTVGYGDRYPVTYAGRLVAMLVMIAGVGLFGTLSGFLANQFLTPPAPKTQEGATAEVDSTDPKVRIAELKKLVEAQEEAAANLRAKLDEIDALL